MSGIEGVPLIRALSPRTQVLILTVHDDDARPFASSAKSADRLPSTRPRP
jgi:DNA-binding NarL/FixJ family response regulator